LADDRLEYLINDRLSFQRFLGLGLGDKVPDSKSIWKFREDLKNSGGHETIFNLFKQALREKGIVTQAGSIIDSTIYLTRPASRPKRAIETEAEAGQADDSTPATLKNLNSERQKTKTHDGQLRATNSSTDTRIILRLMLKANLLLELR